MAFAFRTYKFLKQQVKAHHFIWNGWNNTPVVYSFFSRCMLHCHDLAQDIQSREKEQRCWDIPEHVRRGWDTSIDRTAARSVEDWDSPSETAVDSSHIAATGLHDSSWHRQTDIQTQTYIHIDTQRHNVNICVNINSRFNTCTHAHAHTHTHNRLTAGTTRGGRYQKKHSPTHTHPDNQTSFINFFHLLWSIASSMFSLRAWQSFSTTSLQVLFGLPLGLGPSTPYSTHFITKSSSSFCSTCPYHHSLFFCNTNAMSSIPNLYLMVWLQSN